MKRYILAADYCTEENCTGRVSLVPFHKYGQSPMIALRCEYGDILGTRSLEDLINELNSSVAPIKGVGK